MRKLKIDLERTPVLYILGKKYNYIIRRKLTQGYKLVLLDEFSSSPTALALQIIQECLESIVNSTCDFYTFN